jgi:hypothetical protein
VTSLTFVSSDVKFPVDRCDSTAVATHPCGDVGKRHVGLPKSEIEYQIHLSRYFRLPALRSASCSAGPALPVYTSLLLGEIQQYLKRRLRLTAIRTILQMILKSSSIRTADEYAPRGGC